MSEPTECIVAHDGHMGFWYTGEEIVRCRDCRYYASNMHECMKLDEWDDSLWFPVEQDDFCSYGERREDA